jgi:hypothetical protein
VTSDDLAIAIPLFRRVKNIDRVYNSAMAATPDANVMFAASDGDAAVREALEARCLNHLVLPGEGGEPGDYARKINWIYRATREPLIFTGADDLLFHDHWYEAARDLMGTVLNDEEYEDNPMGVGVVGTRDLCNQRTMDGSHSTHSLVARWYANQGGPIDQDRAIYHEGYVHEYCDDELVQVAMKRGAYAHSFGPPVEHVHMLRDASLDDDTYRHGRERTRLSRRTFMYRSRMWGAETWQHGVTR